MVEVTACILGGVALIGCSLALTRLRPPDWQSDGELTAPHQRAIARWAGLQRVVRLLNNGLLGFIGAAIMATVLVPHGRAWMVLWCAILVLLLICILFAMIDACSSLAGYRRALPEAARRSLGTGSLGTEHDRG